MDKISFWVLSSTKLSDKSTYWILSHKNVGYETKYTEMIHPPIILLYYIHPPELSLFDPLFNSP